MCKQASANCWNKYCKSFAQTLPLLPCENRPNCEIERPRVPRYLRSAEHYCPECRILTKKERRSLLQLNRRKTRRAARATSGAESRAHPGVEPRAESSSMAESRGVVGNGTPLDFNDSVSNTIYDAPANGEVPSVGRFLDATHDPQEINPDAVAPAFDNFTTQTIGLSSPARGNYATGPDPMIALSDLPTTPPHAFGPSNQTAANPLSPFSWNMPSPQFPIDPRLLSEVPSDLTLPQMDPIYDGLPWYMREETE